MKNLLYKELKLFLGPLNCIFLAFPLMVFIPGGYPLLVSSFFIMMGVFISFQIAREHHDTLYTVLLPISKGDSVKARYISITFIQIIAFVLYAIFITIRLLLLSSLEAYKVANLMPGNITLLGFVLMSFAMFNVIFIPEFYKTAYYYAKPFVLFIIADFVLVIIEEALGFVPGLEVLKAQQGSGLIIQLIILLIGLVVYVLSTYFGYKISRNRFEKLDI